MSCMDVGHSESLGFMSSIYSASARSAQARCAGVVLGGVLALVTSVAGLDVPEARATTFSGLPDGRVYEMVTPAANEDANVYAPSVASAGEDEQGIATNLPFQAAAGGGAVAYVGDPSSGGNGSSGQGEGNEYLATRSAEGGWEQQDIQPPGYHTPVYQAFSSDLSVGILNSCDHNLPVLAPGAPADGYNVLYTRSSSNGAYQPLFTTVPTDRTGEEFGAFDVSSYSFECSSGPEGAVFVPAYAGASANLNHLLFEANGALTAQAPNGGAKANNLYDSTDGQLHLVNVLPPAHPGEPGIPAPNATFGAPPMALRRIPDFSHVISSDGSRIFWTDLEAGPDMEHIYVRENDTRTVSVSLGTARFWTATPDSRYAFYTEDEKLWRFDVESETREELANSNVQGVIGANETGEDSGYVYYVAADELYLYHAGTTTPIAPLEPSDLEEVWPYKGAEVTGGDLEPGLGNRTAEVAPDGHSVVFMSTGSLTGYANEGLSEVFVYRTGAGLSCVSCDPSGKPPLEPQSIKNDGTAGFLPISHSNTYLPRWISADGSRVFFDSPEPLVPQDNNGRQDAFEWEREGAGSCPSGHSNCVYLLSGATSSADSWLLDASENGNDVFIITRAQLVAKDQNDDFNVFDVRAGGGTQLTPPECSGTGCQGVPPAPPVFSSPASVTFEGVGNFAPGTERYVAPQPKPAHTTTSRSRRLAAALRACRTKRAGRTRARCKARARKRYG